MEKKRHLYNEFSWYILGAIIPMAVGIVKTTVFTRVFSAEEFGRYGILFITFSILSLILLSWNMNVIWRYFHYFEKHKGRHFFLSNILFLLISQILLFLIISIFYGNLVEKKDQYLIVLFTVQMIVSHMLNSQLTLFRVFSLTKSFNIAQIIRTLVSLGLMFYLVFIRNHTIEVYVEAIILVELPMIMILLFVKRSLFLFKITRISWPIQRLIFSYIPASLVSNLGLILLANSDRYVINHFEGLKSTGLYNQAYNLSMMGLNSLILVFIKIITPKFVQVLEKRTENPDTFMQRSMLFYSVIMLPVTLYFSIYAKDVVHFFMGEDFHESYKVIPWINISVFISGFIYFFELKKKFENKNNRVIGFYLAAIIINFLLNMLFVPVYGYMAASYTTLASYFILLSFFLLGSNFVFFLTKVLFNRVLKISFTIISVQLGVHFILDNYISGDLLFYHVFEGLVFSMIFIIIAIKNRAIRKLFVIAGKTII